MKKGFYILIFILAYFNLSCSEQDFYVKDSLPFLNIKSIDSDKLTLEIKSIKSDTIAVFISKKDLTEKEIDFTHSFFSSDTLDYNTLAKINLDFELIYNGTKEQNKLVTILNLVKLNKYYFYVYKKSKTKYQLEHKLLAAIPENEPKIQAYNVAFSNVTNSEMKISWVPGDGIGRVILMRKDSLPELPNDGENLKFNTIFGTDSAKISKNTYCVYKTIIPTDNEVLITGIKSGKYGFRILEFNGNGEFTNYLTIEASNNPRFKSTSLLPPVALDAAIIDSISFYAKWEKDPEAEFYLLEVSEDENFAKIIENYNSVDVGDSNLVEIMVPESLKNSTIYYRLRASGKGSLSSLSNTIKVNLKK